MIICYQFNYLNSRLFMHKSFILVFFLNSHHSIEILSIFVASSVIFANNSILFFWEYYDDENFLILRNRGYFTFVGWFQHFFFLSSHEKNDDFEEWKISRRTSKDNLTVTNNIWIHCFENVLWFHKRVVTCLCLFFHLKEKKSFKQRFM